MATKTVLTVRVSKKADVDKLNRDNTIMIAAANLPEGAHVGQVLGVRPPTGSFTVEGRIASIQNGVASINPA